MRYANARFKKDIYEKSYRIYVTDALRMIAKQDQYPSDRWYEIEHPSPDVDGDEIAKDIIKRASLVVTE